MIKKPTTILLVVTAAAGLVLFALGGGPGHDRAKAAGYWGPGYRICQQLNIGSSGPLYISASNVRCRKAFRIIREWWRGPDSRQTTVEDPTGGHVLLDRYPGWVCSSGAGAGGCHKGNRHAAYNYLEPRPMSSSSAARAAARPVPKVECLVDGVGQTYKVAPKDCVMYEHGSPGTTILASMEWRNWGRKRARGRGIIHYYDHPEYSGRVVVTLSRIAKGHCVPGRYYTRARIRAVSGRSKGNDFTLNLAAGCPA